MKKAFVLIAVLLPVVAFAQAPDEPPPPPGGGDATPPPPPPPPPGGMTPTPDTPEMGTPTNTLGAYLPNMLDPRPGVTIDTRLDYTNFSSDSGLALDLVLGLTLHGQWISPTQNYGAYATIPYYIINSDSFDDKGIGNVEVGGLYSMKQGPSTDLLLRIGFDVNSGGQSGGAFAPFANLSNRPKDAYVAGIDSHWARAGGSFHHSEGTLRIGAGAGFDFPLSSDARDNFDGLAHGEISVGIEQPGFGFGVGYVILIAVGTDSDDKTISFLNVSGDIPVSPQMKVYAQFGLPDLENNGDQFDIWAVGAGLRYAVN